MSDRYERDAPGRVPEDPAAATDSAGEAVGGDPVDTEVEILRAEIAAVQAELDTSKRATAEAHERFLRARADLENVRRRAAADNERARETGIDMAMLPVIRVFDDLGRAIVAASHAADPAAILPGVQAVRDNFERELEGIGIQHFGVAGEAFDPNLHEALSVIAVTDDAQLGVIAEVFEVGFKRGDRLIRPARVVVYSDHS